MFLSWSGLRPLGLIALFAIWKIETVVVAETVLEAGRGEEADHARAQAQDQRAARTDGAGGRRDRDQPGDRAGGDAEHAGATVDDPFHRHPTERGSGGGDLGNQDR